MTNSELFKIWKQYAEEYETTLQDAFVDLIKGYDVDFETLKDQSLGVRLLDAMQRYVFGADDLADIFLDLEKESKVVEQA